MSFLKSVSRIPLLRVGTCYPWSGIGLQRPFSAASRRMNEIVATSLQTLKDSKKIDSSLFQALNKAGFKTLTPVQEQSMLPIIDEEKGIVCRAKTGTGKTLAFVVPTLQAALDQKVRGKASALIIAPTRDLALQIEAEYHKVKSNLSHRNAKNLHIMTFIGGRKTLFDRRSQPSIVVATPGRLQDLLLNNRHFFESMSDITYRVYDEADRLLDQGFEQNLEEIDHLLYDTRKRYGTNPDSELKSVLFSATVDERVDSFSRNTIGPNYKYINCVDENEPEAHENIHQTLVTTKSIYESHISALSYTLKNISRRDFKAILFIPTVAGTDCIFELLKELKYNDVFDSNSRSRLYRLHGKMTQGARDRTVKEFRQVSNGVLICTDVAARGLDFSDVSDVIQFVPSREVADYIHKVGRTARAGAKGNAILFLSEAEKKYVKTLQRERGVTFAETIKYDTLEQDEEAILKNLELDETVFEEYTKTLLGFYRGICSNYRFDFSDIVAEVINCHRSFHQDPTIKIPVSNNFISNVLTIPPSTASLYFDVPGGFQLNRAANSKRSKMNFLDYGKGNNRSSRDRNNRDRDGGDRGYGSRNFKTRNSRDNNYGGRNSRDDRYNGRNSRDDYGGRNSRDNRNGKSNGRFSEDYVKSLDDW